MTRSRPSSCGGLGGKANVTDVDCCATRLRITVADPAKVSDGLLKQSGASGVVHKGNGIQVIYGPQVAVIKSNLVDFMETPAADAPVDLPAAALAPAPAEKPAEKPAAPARQPQRLGAHLAGTVVPMEQVQDEAFASCVLGEGVAIEPTEGKLYAPATRWWTTCSTPITPSALSPGPALSCCCTSALIR